MSNDIENFKKILTNHIEKIVELQDKGMRFEEIINKYNSGIDITEIEKEYNEKLELESKNSTKNIENNTYYELLTKFCNLYADLDSIGIKIYDILDIYNEKNIEYFDNVLCVLSIQQDNSIQYINEFYKTYFCFNKDFNSVPLQIGEDLYKLPLLNKKYITVSKQEFDKLHKFLDKLNSLITNKYITITNNGLEKRDISTDISDIQKYSQNRNLSRYNGDEGIITADGKFYMSLCDHFELCEYLTANSVDLQNSLRINQDKTGQRKIYLSSQHYFFKSKKAECTKDEENIILNSRQMNTLEQYINTIRLINKKQRKQSINDILLASENLGWNMVRWSIGDETSISRFNLSIAYENLNKFNIYFPGEISVSAFMDEIKEIYKLLNHSFHSIVE